jgi:hypothetical protein
MFVGTWASTRTNAPASTLAGKAAESSEVPAARAFAQLAMVPISTTAMPRAGPERHDELRARAAGTSPVSQFVDRRGCSRRQVTAQARKPRECAVKRRTNTLKVAA